MKKFFSLGKQFPPKILAQSALARVLTQSKGKSHFFSFKFGLQMNVYYHCRFSQQKVLAMLRRLIFFGEPDLFFFQPPICHLKKSINQQPINPLNRKKNNFHPESNTTARDAFENEVHRKSFPLRFSLPVFSLSHYGQTFVGKMTFVN